MCALLCVVYCITLCIVELLMDLNMVLVTKELTGVKLWFVTDLKTCIFKSLSLQLLQCLSDSANVSMFFFSGEKSIKKFAVETHE